MAGEKVIHRGYGVGHHHHALSVFGLTLKAATCEQPEFHLQRRRIVGWMKQDSGFDKVYSESCRSITIIGVLKITNWHNTYLLYTHTVVTDPVNEEE